MESRDASLPFLFNLNATPLPLYPRLKHPVTVVREAGWAPGPFWKGKENLPPRGFDPPIFQPVASHSNDYNTNLYILK